jgi:hypothetical protein
MAGAVCVNTHNQSVKTQGAGACCAALPPGVPHVGQRFSARTKRGACFVCEVIQRKGGHLGFKRGKSCDAGVCLCPTAVSGCCKLLAAA